MVNIQVGTGAGTLQVSCHRMCEHVNMGETDNQLWGVCMCHHYLIGQWDNHRCMNTMGCKINNQPECFSSLLPMITN